MSRIVLSLLVDNTAGVLSRVAGLFSRRGYNIESLTVGVTADPRYSRMTVVSLGDHQVLEQIQKQLGKLEDVHDIKELREGAPYFFALCTGGGTAGRIAFVSAFDGGTDCLLWTDVACDVPEAGTRDIG